MSFASAMDAALVERPRLTTQIRDALEHGAVALVGAAGYGKTLLVEQALAGRTAAWMSCRGRDVHVDRLMIDALQAIRRAVPGAADVLLQQVTTADAAPQPADVARALLDELESLLVEPLVFVVDDAEHLADAPAALEVLEQLIEAPHDRLRMVVCTRRPLPMRAARPQAAGRLLILNESDLAFSAEECAELLERRLDRPPTDAEVAEAMQTTLGWPLGLAVGASVANPSGAIARFLREEVLAALDPATRAAMLTSSAAEELTPAMSEALGLPPDLATRLGTLGVLLRPVAGRADAVAYHPLLRDVLRQAWVEETSPAERAFVLSRAAAQLRREGRIADAIDAWLAAGEPDRALDALVDEAVSLVRTAPGSVHAWLDLVPEDFESDPRRLAVAGWLAFAEGRHEEAVPLLREASERLPADIASRPADDAAEALYWLGRLPEGLEVLEQIRRPTANTRSWTAIMQAALGRVDDAIATHATLDRLPDAEAIAGMRAIVRFYVDVPDGRHDELVALTRRRLESLGDRRRELHRPEILASFVAFALADAGRADEAVGWTDVVFAEVQRSGLHQFLSANTHALRAWLLVAAGREVEAELALGAIGDVPTTDGWAPAVGETAAAACLLARGDRAAAQAVAEGALTRAASAPLPFRTMVTLAALPVIGEVAAPEHATGLATAALEDLDRAYGPGHGTHHRARLLAQRAWMHGRAGDLTAAASDLQAALTAAGDRATILLRSEWRRIGATTYDVLTLDDVVPGPILSAVERAFPGGEELASFADHPRAAVRVVAARALASSGDPRAETLLDALAADEDPQVVAAAEAARVAGRRSPPPRTFTLFGAFSLRRGEWAVDERAWGRPTTARLVRILLVQRGAFLPEEELLDALWPDKPPKSARSSIQVAVSRARAVLDVPGAEQSAIQYSERAYRLVLDERDRVDTELFAAAADAALAEHGPNRLRLLEHAASLWTGEPMPEERYSDWASEWREDLTASYRRVLWALCDQRGRRGDHAGAAAAATRLVALDPLDEGAQRLLIAAHARAGNRAQALRQYLACRKQLVDALGLEPDDETRRLQRRVLAGQPV
ncbi:MAG TPA: BTAD domain-containing putative transcriptional regulator [Capillimicrobium sp.]|nr:BTAD domain-containing putative transcriptional regulator [Capillimicrobium sp.]